MDMIDNDDKLLIDFLSERKPSVPDDGFSHRVMRSLPDRAYRLSRLWMYVCIVAGVALAVAGNAVGQLASVAIDVVANVVAGLSVVSTPHVSPWLMGAALYVMVMVVLWRTARQLSLRA